MVDAQALTGAFGAGMVATFNPCGFAMLPAYLSYFLGLEDRSRDAQAGVLRALTVGLAVSLGFMAVFFVTGVVFSAFTTTVGQHLPWATIVIGLALMVLGVAMLRGFEPVLSLPKLQRGTRSRELPSMFVFGVSYAVSSLSCTIGLFIALVGSTIPNPDFGASLTMFLAYGAGMALVLMALTLAIALARQGLVRAVRRVLPYVSRVAGGFLVLAGAYLAYYGWYELSVYNSPTSPPGGPASTVFEWNRSMTTWIQQNDPRRIGIALLAVLVVAVLIATGWQGSGSKPSSRSPRPRTKVR